MVPFSFRTEKDMENGNYISVPMEMPRDEIINER